MYLLIDARGEDEIYVSFWNRKGAPKFKIYKKGRTSFLEFVLNHFGNFIKEYKKILIIPGPGGFSIVRTAVIFANTISFVTQIPVVKVEVRSAETKEAVFSRVISLLKNKKQALRPILPIYDREPNITLKKT